MDDKRLAELLNHDSSDVKTPKNEWNKIEEKIQLKSRVKYKIAVPVFLALVIGVFTVQNINQKNNEDILLAEYLYESTEYFEEDDDDFYY